MLAPRTIQRLLLCCALAPLFRAASAQQIPVTNLTALNGATLVLPEQVKGHVTVCLVGFSRAAGEQVTAWANRLHVEYPASSGVAALQFAMLAEAPRLVRGMIVSSMRRSTAASDQGALFPVLADADAWKRFAGYSGGDDAYVVLLDAVGTVRLRVHGPVAAREAEVKAAIDGLLKAQAAR